MATTSSIPSGAGSNPFEVYIKVAQGSGTIRCDNNDRDFYHSSTSTYKYYTGFTSSSFVFSAEPDDGYELSHFYLWWGGYGYGIYQESRETYYDTFEIGPGADFVCVQAYFEEESSGGGGGGGDDDWDWGDEVAELSDSDWDTDFLSEYEVDYITFTPDEDGTVTAYIWSPSYDVVLYYCEGSGSFDDDTDPDNLIDWDDYSDDPDTKWEELEFRVKAGRSYEIGWYDYEGAESDVDWEITFTPEVLPTKYRCWDLTTASYIPGYSDVEKPQTTASSITRPNLSGYTYVGYTCYGNWPDNIDAGTAGNFNGTGTICTMHNGDDLDCVIFFYRSTPPITAWQTPIQITSIAGSTYTSYSATSSINKYNAGYVKYTTPAYAGKLVMKTTSATSTLDYYSYLSTATLSAASGTARTAAVSGTTLTTDDNNGGGYNPQTSYICAASTTYNWYVNGPWAASGTHSVSWSLNYYREYTITYNVNGGTGTISSQKFYTDNLSVPLTTQTPSRTNYIFLGWATSNTATTPNWTSGQTASLSATNYTLYAVWQQALSTYTITYNANGGSGAPGAVSVLQNSNVTIDTSTIPIKAGYIFKGWSTNSTATKPLYKKGSVSIVNMQSNITLYAVWWPDFNWNEKNAAEGQHFNNLISGYITNTNNTAIATGSIYDVLWFNNIAAKLRHPSKVGGDLITDADLNSLVNYYREY